MGDKTNIPWTDATWNPMTGCSKISAGCQNCYAEKMAKRLKAMGQERYANGFKVTCHDNPDLLDQPMRWERSRMIFVCSMGDLFHDHVPDEFITKVYTAMVPAKQHVFQVLTKRADRMQRVVSLMRQVFGRENMEHICHGVSIEDGRVWHRLEALKRTPSSYRFVSFEPLIGGVPTTGLFGIDWAIIGGESGPKARPVPLEHVKGIVEQCATYQIPCFVKQLGAVWARDNCHTRKGDDIKAWPVWARVQDFPRFSGLLT